MSEINDVVTTVTHVCAKFEELVKQHIPAAGVIYDNDLSYETGIKLLIDKHNFTESQKGDTEVFIYNRSILETSELGAAARTKSMTGSVRVGDEVLSYDVVQGEFDLNFMYTSHDIRNVEKFETAYIQNQTIAKEKMINVDLGEDIGKFDYFMTALPLTDYVIQHEGASYNAVLGTFRVRGMFFTFKGSKKIIAKINLRVFHRADPLENSELIESATFQVKQTVEV